jgi:hypothetical protein
LAKTTAWAQARLAWPVRRVLGLPELPASEPMLEECWVLRPPEALPAFLR